MSKLFGFFKNNYKDIFKPIIVLLAICVIIPLALAFTNDITVDKISALEKKNSRAAMQRLIKADEYEENSFKSDKEDVKYYVAVSKKETCGYIFTVSENGYGGDVSVMTAVNTDGTVKAVEILDVSNETPGLGQNAAKESFYSQFSGKFKDIELVKGSAQTQSNAVNAVTGATITSTAVTKAINKALDYYAEISEKEADASVKTEGWGTDDEM